MGLALLDWVVLVAYFLACIAIGVFVGLKVKDSHHYFLGGRKFGKWLMIGQSFGVGTHAEMPVSLAGAVYGVGASAIWFQWKNLFITPFYWIMAPVFRRVRRTTIAEMLQDRYGAGMGAVYTVFALCFFTLNSASMLKGAGKVIGQAMGGLSPDAIVVAMTVVFMAYSFVGGLASAAWTDLFQGFLIIALSFMLIPLGWSLVGGLDGMKATLAAPMFSLATPKGITPWFIFVLTLNGLIGIMAQPHMLAAVGTGKDERTCRIGMFYGNFVKRVCTVGWALVGLMVAALVAKGAFGTTKLEDPELAFGFACRHLLFPGTLGLMIASVLAANMSTCSAFMVDSGALFTQGFYKKYLAPGRGDGHYLWMGRLSGVAITLLGVVYAIFLIDKVLYSFLLTETLATYMGISLVGGILWSRANRWGAIASLVASLGTNFWAYQLRGERLDHWNPDVFLASLGAGTAAFVLMSLLTRREPREAVDGFRARLQTPEEADPGASGPEPSREVAESGRQLLLVNLLNLNRGACGAGILRAYRTDLGGFAVGWLMVLALVAATALFLGS